MIWLSRFWPIIPLAIVLGLFVFLTHRLETVKDQRDGWEKSAKAYQQSAEEWKASFLEAEKRRKNEQEGAVQAVNASELSCEARIASARSSAVKIERIVTNAPVCKPGEAIPRTLADPGELLGAIGVR